MEKLILYARKSTDTEDKQVLSIEAQLVELTKPGFDIAQIRNSANVNPRTK